MSFQSLPYTIIKDTGGKADNVFLYSYLPGKKKQESDITIPVGQSNSVSFNVYNLFSIALHPDLIQLLFAFGANSATLLFSMIFMRKKVNS